MSTAAAPKNGSTAIAKPTETTISYIPLGEQEQIHLTLARVKQFLCPPTKSGKVATDEQVMKFMMLCKAQSLNPWVNDAYLTGFDSKDGPSFSLITSHQAFLKRAEASSQYDGMESGVIVQRSDQITERQGDLVLKGETLVGGWARVHRKDRSVPSYDALNLSTFDKNQSRWNVDKSGMIVKCFDVETEVLTDQGFQRFSQVNGKILQVVDSGLEPVDAVPFVQDYLGPMVVNANQNLDFCVTPNHDMLTSSGKIEAGEMFAQGRLRPKHFIPRCVRGSKSDLADLSDDSIRLAAIFACDGSSNGDHSFLVSVSRPRKIALLESIAKHVSRHVRKCEGDKATTNAGRTITTRHDKQQFRYQFKDVSRLIGRDKMFHLDAISRMSARQASVFIDTMIQCDGSVTGKSGVRRFYASRRQHIAAMEIAAVIAGQSVSPVSSRLSEGATRPNLFITLTGKNEMPVRRHGGCAKEPSMEMMPNTSGKVWCVTVPSGVIVVRRNGFSMLCGNCAEASALRKAFPSTLAAMYIKEEMERDRDQSPQVDARPKVDRLTERLISTTPESKPVESVQSTEVDEVHEPERDVKDAEDWPKKMLGMIGKATTGEDLDEYMDMVRDQKESIGMPQSEYESIKEALEKKRASMK